MLAVHTCRVARGTHHSSRQLTPDLHCQGKARAESGTCVWKCLSWTVSDKLSEQHMTLHTAEAVEVGSVTGASETWVGTGISQVLTLAFLFVRAVLERDCGKDGDGGTRRLCPWSQFIMYGIRGSSPGNVGRSGPSVGLSFLTGKIRRLETVSTTPSDSDILSTVN